MISYTDLSEVVKRLVRPINNRVMMLLGRCVLLATNDSEGIQKINATVLAGENLTDIEKFSDYGYTSHAPDESEGVIIFPMGNRENGICIKMDNREFRLKNLAKGEVALYTDEGDSIQMKRGNNIIVDCKNKVTINVTNEAEINTKKMSINATESIKFVTPYFEVDAPESRFKTGNITVDQNTTTGNLSVLGNYGSGGAQVKGDISIIPSITNGNGTITTVEGDIKTTNGDIKTTNGDIEDKNSKLDDLRTIYNGHTHNHSVGTVSEDPNQKDN